MARQVGKRSRSIVGVGLAPTLADLGEYYVKFICREWSQYCRCGSSKKADAGGGTSDPGAGGTGGYGCLCGRVQRMQHKADEQTRISGLNRWRRHKNADCGTGRAF